MRRIVIGLGITAVAVASAAGIEVYRRGTDLVMQECTAEMLEDLHPYCTPDQLGTQIPVVSVCAKFDEDTNSWPVRYVNEASMFWMVVPYFIVGCAEIMVAATYYDVFYAEVPPVLRTLCQTMSNFATSLGTLVGAMVTTIMQSLVKDDLNDSKLEYVYIVWVALSLISMLFQQLVSRRFECHADIEYLEQIRLEKEAKAGGGIPPKVSKGSLTREEQSLSSSRSVSEEERAAQKA